MGAHGGVAICLGSDAVWQPLTTLRGPDEAGNEQKGLGFYPIQGMILTSVERLKKVYGRRSQIVQRAGSMRCRVSVIVLLGVCCWLCEMSLAQPTPIASIPRSSAISPQDDILSPEMAAARKAALQTQMEAFERSNIPEEERAKARVPLHDLLDLLNALEAARQRHATFRQQLDTLPKRLAELAATQKALDAWRPGEFPQVTEALRDQYDSERHNIQAEIEDLLRQNSAAEARLAAIPQELEQRLTERPKLQQRLAEAQRQSLQLDQPNMLMSEVSSLEIQLQLLLTEIKALEAERRWLVQRGSLHDMLLRVAETKLSHIQQDLSAITDKLGKTFEQEREILSEKILELEQSLKLAKEPVEALQLTVHLEVARMRQATADYRQQLNQLNNEVLSQEQLTIQQRQDSDRLASLFEKYASGESGGDLLLLAFERFRLDRQRFRDTSVKELQVQLRAVTKGLYEAEDRLYSYDRQVKNRVEDLLPVGQSLPMSLRKAFD